MERLDAMLPTLVPVFIALVFGAIVFAIVASCIGVFAGLIHASKDKNLQRSLQAVLTNAKAHGDLLKSYKEAGVDPTAAPFAMPSLMQPMAQPLGSPIAPARKGLGVVTTSLLAVIAVCLVIIAAGQLF